MCQVESCVARDTAYLLRREERSTTVERLVASLISIRSVTWRERIERKKVYLFFFSIWEFEKFEIFSFSRNFPGRTLHSVKMQIWGAGLSQGLRRNRLRLNGVGLLTRCPGSRSCSWPGKCVDRAGTERRATGNVY